MLRKLKIIINKKGLVQVSHDLGYRSINSINNWIKKGKIPNCASEKVSKYVGVTK